MELRSTGHTLESYRLTDREIEYIVLRCRCPEPTKAEIAEQMDISPKTVDVHQGKVYRKLGVSTLLELYHKAVGLGLVKCMCKEEGAK